MEADSQEEKKTPDGGELKPKRKMKTPAQLEILEQTYAEDRHPPEAVRAELSVKLGLTDRQLQMWFCHRRLKDKKAPLANNLHNGSPGGATISTPLKEVGEEMLLANMGNEHGISMVSGSTSFGNSNLWREVPHPGGSYPGTGSDLSAMKRQFEPQQAIAELRAIALVETILGEPIREDGPVLGIEFDSLPPGAFGTPIVETTVEQERHRQSGWPYEANLYEQSNGNSNKCISRTPHEYEFLPLQPTARADTCERVVPTYHLGSSDNSANNMTSSLFHKDNGAAVSQYGLKMQMPGLNTISQLGSQESLLSSAPVDGNNIMQQNSVINLPVNTHYVISEQRVIYEEELARTERKRKSEEVRTQREHEAQEKRIRKEIEKQDILVQKREEHLRKEMERHSREKQKEEERLMRERQREEERFQREQRRELERRERLLHKESVRAEKMRQKEELRREKEAARIKAANERAVARKMAKESMELIQDERLELMELAVSNKGLPSILNLDSETMQNLDLYKDMCTPFPPNSVQLKEAFSTQPWSNSEENVGNLLMVWRFLVAFADVLELWPFTLDELVQAFHDYDPRLLGEIHTALLRSIIKDIEHAARMPATSIGANQYTAASFGGGHPQIVEGAYAWGFDIQNWQRYLNPLTWPEILRQFALSAGFGPQLKKRNTDQPHLCDEKEGNDGVAIVASLHSGAAVANAVAIMKERGLSNSRRSRHRLTPGTVKFAAFHVLSLEGSEGLTILEVAERIQKSGLRDLTTSKTPEASIAAAFSRDLKLFERVAPSTYCVRPAYRKDPSDAESILSAARERIKAFQSGVLGSEPPDEAERDEDSESDDAEDAEIDDLGSDITPDKQSLSAQELKAKEPGRDDKSSMILQTLSGSCDHVMESLPSTNSKCLNEVNEAIDLVNPSAELAGCSNGTAYIEDKIIDKNNYGEPWVWGLMEGEYCDLSVEERLNALVALIGVALEGNSIRAALEERLEAANALKKQMLALALDKRRIKEDYVVRMHHSSCLGSKRESNFTVPSQEVNQSAAPTVISKDEDSLVSLTVPQEQLYDRQNEQNHLKHCPSEDNLQVQDLHGRPDIFSIQQTGFTAERFRSCLKSYINHMADEIYMYRSLPLGLDRRGNRYWQFIASASQCDPGNGRIFVELYNGHWRLLDSEKGFDALLTSLDIRGVRESHLHAMLQRIEKSFRESVRRKPKDADVYGHSSGTVKVKSGGMSTCQDHKNDSDNRAIIICGIDADVLETSTSFAIHLGITEFVKTDALHRYMDLEKWMWRQCLNSSVMCALKYGKERWMELFRRCPYCHQVYFVEDSHCPSCHRTYSLSKRNLNLLEHSVPGEEKLESSSNYEFQYSPPSPLRIRLLKVLLSLVEVCLPTEALQPHWTSSHRKSWRLKLHSSSVEDLLQLLTIMEGAIKKDYMASEFETTSELLASFDSRSSANGFLDSETTPVIPWIPHTTAAIALRLMDLDASISYKFQQKVEPPKQKSSDLTKPPSRYAIGKRAQDDSKISTSYQAELQRRENQVDVGTGMESTGKGGRRRGQCYGLPQKGKSKKKITTSRSEPGKVISVARSGQVLRWKGKRRLQGACRNGQRSTRSRPSAGVKAHGMNVVIKMPKDKIMENPQLSCISEEYEKSETVCLQGDDAENAGFSDKSAYAEVSAEAAGNDYNLEYEEDGCNGSSYNGKSYNLIDESDHEMEEEDVDQYAHIRPDDQVDGDDISERCTSSYFSDD